MGALLDISRPLSPSTAVWPGDRPVEWSWTMRKGEATKGEAMAVNVGALTTSTHAGTHADAPLHVASDAPSVDLLPLEPFIGPAEVVHVEDTAIRPSHVVDLHAPRVLFRTAHSDVDASEWTPDVAPLLPATVKHLAAHDVVLVGTDAPSVDPVDSKTLPAHHALIDAGIVALENLSLGHVAPGCYELVALPLRIVGADASPVRAILRTDAASGSPPG